MLLVYIYLCYCFVHNTNGGTSQDKRIKQLQMNVRKINRLLNEIEEGKSGCNTTLFTVSGKLDVVTRLVDDIYPAELDMSRGYNDNYDKVTLKLPGAMDECVKSFKGTKVPSYQAEIACLQQMLWRYEEPEKARDFRRIGKLIQRFKHNTTDIKFHTQRPRLRKEYRTLTTAERTKFHNALQALYDAGIIRDFAKLHGWASQGAHGGPAFLPWHRVFITLFEDALREMDPSVTLPYWDSTMDNAMDNPVNSIMWSWKYCGNGAGVVNTGPFAYWTSSVYFLERAYGVHPSGRLISKENVADMMTKCHFEDISRPSGQGAYILERFHDRVHVWMGGDMGSVPTAAYDPVFYMHHCYIDYLWEKFRRRQRTDTCSGVDPVTEYPANTIPSQGYLDDLMELDGYSVWEGMTEYWTSWVYHYAESPTCQNDCGGSDVLYCDAEQNCCLPKRRFTSPTDILTWRFPGMQETLGEPPIDYTYSSDCDRYLDPYCLRKNNKLNVKTGNQIQPAEELEIIRQMFPVPRGTSFDEDLDSGRSLRTLKADIASFNEKRRPVRTNVVQKRPVGPE